MTKGPASMERDEEEEELGADPGAVEGVGDEEGRRPEPGTETAAKGESEIEVENLCQAEHRGEDAEEVGDEEGGGEGGELGDWPS